MDHGTFHRRDERRNTSANSSRYGTFTVDDALPGQPPWAGADTTGLRTAIEQYVKVWFPGAWPTAPPPAAAARPIPSAVAAPTGETARTR